VLLTEIGVSIPLTERGAAGVPGTTPTGINLASRAESYEHTIASRGGFESMRTSFAADLDEAIDIFNNWLMRSTVVTGPDTETIWEGYLSEISISLGGRKRSISLEKMYNSIRPRYSDDQGIGTTASVVSDASSIATYGTKQLVVALGGSSLTAATNAATQVLAKYKNPPQTPSTEIATGAGGDVRVDLLFRGWYATLGWVLTSRTSTTFTATNTQIGALIAASGVGIGVTNAFLSTSTAQIGATGVSDTEYIAPLTPYQDKIEALVAQGDGVDRWVLMCLEGRLLTFRKWAGATPAIPTYVSPLGSHAVYTPDGSLVPPWEVRPDTMYQEIGLLDASPVSTAYDAATRQYVERVTCSVSGDRIGVTLEPAASDSVDALLARLSA
jgi:hypothetical protein